MSIFQPVTVITGASTGIGAVLVRLFAAAGHQVAMVARREQPMQVLAAEVAVRTKIKPHVLAVDLGRSDAPARIAHELLGRGLEPEYVVNNAGFGLVGPAASLDRAEQMAMIDLNVRALTDLSLRWVDSLTRNRGGILNVASVAGFVPAPGMAVYHATKAYVLSFTEALHEELKPAGVRVTALCPGPVPTAFQARAGVTSTLYPPILTMSAEAVAKAGFEGLMAGKAIVMPGVANRTVAFLPRLFPRAWVRRITHLAQSKRTRTTWPRRRA